MQRGGELQVEKRDLRRALVVAPVRQVALVACAPQQDLRAEREIRPRTVVVGGIGDLEQRGREDLGYALPFARGR